MSKLDALTVSSNVKRSSPLSRSRSNDISCGSVVSGVSISTNAAAPSVIATTSLPGISRSM